MAASCPCPSPFRRRSPERTRRRCNYAEYFLLSQQVLTKRSGFVGRGRACAEKGPTARCRPLARKSESDEQRSPLDCPDGAELLRHPQGKARAAANPRGARPCEP